MKIKEFLKPNILNIGIFVLIGIFYLFLAGQKTCGAGYSFDFCYKTTGFPLQYILTGDINSASALIKEIPLGSYFIKSGNALLNPAAFALDVVFIYLLSCFISFLFRNMEIKKS